MVSKIRGSDPDRSKDSPVISDPDSTVNPSTETGENDETPSGYTRYRPTQKVYARRVEEPSTVVTANGPVTANEGDYEIKEGGPNSPTRVVQADFFEDNYETD